MALLELICLANARKRSERCVACLRADGGGWIRLVSNAEHRELTYMQRNLGNAGEPQNFDLIQVDVAQALPVPGQPENHLIGNRPWQLLERPARCALGAVLAANLYQGTEIFGSRSDRLPASSFAYLPPAYSLALIRPQQARFCHEIHGSKKLVRAHFSLGPNHYNLSVTDPPFEQRVKSLRAGEYSLQDVGIAREDRMLFCVSLGEPFSDENCYKLVAGVLILPENWPATSPLHSS